MIGRPLEPEIAKCPKIPTQCSIAARREGTTPHFLMFGLKMSAPCGGPNLIAWAKKQFVALSSAMHTPQLEWRLRANGLHGASFCNCVGTCKLLGRLRNRHKEMLLSP